MAATLPKAVMPLAAVRSTLPSQPVIRKTGVVIAAGLAPKTVKVRVGAEEWQNKVKKYFGKSIKYLVHDPKNSVRLGDVVSIVPGRASKMKRYVVDQILAPFGPPVEERPKVLTGQEREQIYLEKKRKKHERQHLRRSSKMLHIRFNKVQKVVAEVMAEMAKLKLTSRAKVSGKGKLKAAVAVKTKAAAKAKSKTKTKTKTA